MDYASIKRTFDHYDKDHNGKISREEFMMIYSKQTPQGAQSTVDYLLKTYDTNKDGFISFDEFVMMMTGGKGFPNQTPASTHHQGQSNYTHQPIQSQNHHKYQPVSQPQPQPVANPNSVQKNHQGAKVMDPAKEHLPTTKHAFKLCPMGTPLNEAHLENKQVYVPKTQPSPQTH